MSDGPLPAGGITHLVTTLSDIEDAKDGQLSLREAINRAQAGDVIFFETGLAGGTVTLTNGALNLNNSITISGDTDGDGRADITISGAGQNRVFDITAGHAVLTSLVITGGHAESGGGLNIESGATLKLSNSLVAGNKATGASGAGGGIANAGTLEISNSTILANTADKFGAGIYNANDAVLVNVTVAENLSFGVGGGVYTETEILIEQSTLTNNLAEDGFGGVASGDPASAPVNLLNSIVSGNFAAGGKTSDADSSVQDVNSFVGGDPADVLDALGAPYGGGVPSDQGGVVDTVPLQKGVSIGAMPIAGALNIAPDAIDDTAAATDAAPLVIPFSALFANDLDVNGDAPKVVSFDNFSLLGAALIDNNDGSLTYDATTALKSLAAGEVASDSFTYTISDATGATDTARVRVEVTGLNQGPGNIPSSAFINQTFTEGDAPFSVDLTTIATDPEGDPLSVTNASSPVRFIGDPSNSNNGPDFGASVVGNILHIDPGATEAVQDGVAQSVRITYQLVDPGGAASKAVTATITVIGTNSDPMAAPDVHVVDEDTASTFDVLANDTDADTFPMGDDLSVLSLDTSQTTGLVTLDPVTGQPRYDPNGQFEALREGETAEDSYAYTVSDGNGGTSTTSVAVQITGVNDIPVAVDDATSTPFEAPLILDVLANDTDADAGDSKTLVSVADAIGGTAHITGDKIVFRPADGFVGEAGFTYVMADELGATSEASVTVSVGPDGNAAPEARDDRVTTDENTPILVDVLANDSDSDGPNGNLQIVSVEQTGRGRSEIVGNQILFDPDGDYDYLGVDDQAWVPRRITYTISDGLGGFASAILSVDLTGINTAPTARNDTFSVAFEEAAIFNLVENDNDVDGDNFELAIDSVGNFVGGTVTLSPVRPDLATFTPDDGFFGRASFSYVVRDTEGALSDPATVFVDVSAPGNTLPVAQIDNVLVAEDTPTLIDVLANDTDADAGDTLTLASVEYRFPADGAISIVNNQLHFDPSGAFDQIAEGSTSFRILVDYVVSDGRGGTDTGLATIEVQGANDAPVTVDDVAFTDFGETVFISAKLNDFDVDGPSPSFVSVGDLDGGIAELSTNFPNSIRFTPDPGFSGVASFTYVSEDNLGALSNPATVFVHVADEINIDPVAVDDRAATAFETAVLVDVLANDTDDNFDDTLSLLSVSDLVGGTAEIQGDQVLFTPNAGFVGAGGFSYVVQDDKGGQAQASVTVTVAPGPNNIPTANDDTFTVPENAAVVLDVLANDTDPDSFDTLSVLSIDKIGVAGNLQLVDGRVEYEPGNSFDSMAPGDTATVSFSYTLTDDRGGTDTADVTVTIEGENDAPRFLGTLGTQFNEDDAPTSFSLLGIASDPEGDPLEVVGSVVLPQSGDPSGVSIVGDTVFVDPSAYGYLVFGQTLITEHAYDVSDGNGGISRNFMTLRFFGADDVNNLPEFDAAGPFTVAENTLSVGTITASDADGQDLIFAVTGGADQDLFDIDTNTGALSFLAAPDFEAPQDAGADNVYDIDVGVFDGIDAVYTPVSITVTDVDETPGPNIINGTPGPDTLTGTAGRDIINGLAAKDTLSGAGGDDDIFGNAGQDVLNGNRGNDRLEGGLDDDMLFGGADDDILLGGEGDDDLDGGAGIDTASYEGHSARVVVSLNAPGDTGQGVDQFTSIENLIGTSFNDRLTGDQNDNEIWGRSGDDTITGLGGNDILHGEDGNDTLIGSGGDDVLNGGDGDDTIDGVGGRDTLNGEAGDDMLVGGVGVDTISGGDGHDDIFGNFGVDVIDGGSGNDNIRADGSGDIVNGGAGNDRMVGGNGKDNLFGGAGNDVLFGGGGSGNGDGLRDIFVFKSAANGGGGFDIIRDFENNIDKIDVSDSGYATIADVMSDATQVGANVEINFDFGGLLRIENFDLTDLNTGDFLLT